MGGGKGTSTHAATEITEWLRDIEHADRDAARQAGRVVARAWSDREFYASATALPIARCLRASPEMTGPLDAVLARLARRFSVHLHECAAWDPKPHWRKEIVDE
ncbi:hypothetical protein [Amycolatopsis orientalis]|uniref:hypothetical protein n=1 Tax=Amycolatopsis orientalis TaxID=31958 RepID=UPI00040BF530|nr:hypothetical protein [Amycolatopsis orientalis]